MKMEMKKCWPEHKVYLFGQLSFLTVTLENKALQKAKMRHYFPHETTAEFENVLREYEDKGYFKVELLEKVGEPKRYMLTNINKGMFYKELSLYLNNLKLDDDRLELLLSLAARQHKECGYEPVIMWRDLYDNLDTNSRRLPFWEFIFMLEIRGQIQLKTAEYTKTVPFLVEDGLVEKMPIIIQRRYERPIVKLAIIDKKLQRKVSKPRTAIRYKVGIVLTPSGKLQLVIDGKRHTLRNYKSEDNNTYRSAKALYDAKRPLLKSELNLKPDSKTPLKGLIKNMHITGILAELFIVYGFDQRNFQVVSLKHHANVDGEQHERLLEYVKTLSIKSQ